MKEIEEEAAMLRRMQVEVEKEFNAESNSPPTSTFASIEEKMEADGRSIYIGNVSFHRLFEKAHLKCIHVASYLFSFLIVEGSSAGNRYDEKDTK